MPPCPQVEIDQGFVLVTLILVLVAEPKDLVFLEALDTLGE
jgi:hypothetical protein